MNLRIKINTIIWPGIIFFGLFMIIQCLNNPYITLAYFVLAEFFMYVYLANKKNVSSNARRLFLLIVFFWFQEFSSAQDIRILKYSAYVIEVVVLTYLLYYVFQHIKMINKQQYKLTAIIMCAFLFVNFISIMFTYKKISIFLFSSYDSCKYFVLIYYILSIRPSEGEFKELLDLLVGVVIMHTFCAVFQFAGYVPFFNFFRGRFGIVSRMGNYRAIGMFPHGIELGNYSCVLFALYYCYSKLTKGGYLFTKICLIICVLASGTRTSLAILLVIIILANLNNTKGWVKSFLMILMVLAISSNFIDFDEMLGRTKWDMSTQLPRTYYMMKGIEIWMDHPIFGIGFNTYGSLKYRERTDDIIFNTYNIHDFSSANLATTDSFVAEIVPEFGVFGIALIIFYALQIYRYLKEKKNHQNYYQMFLIVIVTISIMAINTSTPFISPHIGSWFWISCGFLLDSGPEEFLRLKKDNFHR